MRSRNKEVILWLSEEEYNHLRTQISKTNLTMQAYLRALITNMQIRAKPHASLVSILKELQQISNSMNQIALKTSTLNGVDTNAYWRNVDELKSVIRKLLEVMYG